MVKLTIIECSEEERQKINEDMARVGATRLSREVRPTEVSYYSLLIRHGVRAPCRPGACGAHEVWDGDRCYNHCERCGALPEQEGG